MDELGSMVGKTVKLELSGLIDRIGIMIDYGLDLVVLFDGINYVYIPFGHVQNIRLYPNQSNTDQNPPYERTDAVNELSYRKILIESKGMFVQLFVAGNQSIHGYVTSVLSDYFVFFSPVHRTLLIPMFHLKWLIPYPENETPYSISREQFPYVPSQVKLYRTFEEQLKKMAGKIVVFDLGNNPEKIGLLRNISNKMIELVIADQKTLYWNIHHIKMVHCPNL